MALSDDDGEQRFRFSENPALASIGYLDLHGAPGDRVLPEIYAMLEEHPVQTRRIDSLIAAGQAAPHFIKLDVEGAEVEVLRGAEQLLREQRPVMAIEVHNVTCMFHVQALLFAAGYTTALVDEPERSASRAFIWARPK
jgi:FkbM family methyltransferase